MFKRKSTSKRIGSRRSEKRSSEPLEIKPVITVDGNHDFISLGDMLKHYAYAGEVHQISEHGIVEFGGLKWVGHGYIPWIEGEWRGELRTPEMMQVVDKVWDHGNADILVTHTAPAGIS